MSVENLIILIVVFVVVVILLPSFVRQRLSPGGRSTSHVKFPTPAETAATKAEIERRNAHEYSIEDIPPDVTRLTLYRRYWENRGEAVAGAYLYPGIRSRDDCQGRNAPAPYYPNKLAIWSWDGDNTMLDNDGLLAQSGARAQRMRALLEQNGWRATSQDEQVWLVHFYREQSETKMLPAL